MAEDSEKVKGMVSSDDLLKDGMAAASAEEDFDKPMD